MFKKRNLYNTIFFAFFLSIVFTFFYFRPLNSEWYRIITADGLGYYSYLPAKFIYNDENLDFKWFNDVYNQYYKYNSFATPVENFTAEFNGKQINKYYPGMSFLWMPFFLGVHAVCKVFGLHANGFSQPYQMAIGFAAVFYTCLGLWFLRKFLLKLFKNELIALLVPITIFYGTNLFTFTIYSGSFTHAYGFTFITMALYFAWCFFNEEQDKFKNGLWFLLCTLIVVFVRPINILFLLAVPAFMNRISIKEILKQIKLTPIVMVVMLIIGLLSYWHFSILYTQTQSLFPNTYSNEKFHFERGAHLFDILLSYHAGWFLYVPIALISVLSLIFIGKRKQNLFLFLLLAVVSYLYSNWWFYTIFWRVIVDFSGVVALLLGYFLFYILQKQKTFRIALTVVILSVFYFQLKAYQFRNSILDANYNYSDYYWKNFFTIRPLNIYPVHPQTILKKTEYEYNYDAVNDSNIVSEIKYQGKGALKLHVKNHFSEPHLFKMPEFTGQQGFSKIKTSFYVYFTDSIKSMQLVYAFQNKGKQLFYFTNYIQMDRIRYNEWDYKEIGCDVPREVTASDTVSIFFWNDWGVNKVYIDKVKHEFFLTDASMEMVP
ncbi:MAG: hypothetical protein KA163_04505 [Bacteroidia bacterium]|nr:hypothetical protein [Bacteroidia bacterium]